MCSCARRFEGSQAHRGSPCLKKADHNGGVLAEVVRRPERVMICLPRREFFTCLREYPWNSGNGATSREDERPEVPNVPKVVDGRTAAVHSNGFAGWVQRHKFLNGPRQRIKQFQAHDSSSQRTGGRSKGK